MAKKPTAKKEELLRFRKVKDGKTANICIRFSEVELRNLREHVKKGAFPSMSDLVRQVLGDAGVLS